MPDHGSQRWGFAAEHDLQDSALSHFPELDLVDQASLALGFILQTIDEGKSAEPIIANALALMSVLAFRAARAAGLVIACGYSSEAFVQARRLSEFAGEAAAIIDDRSQQRAALWLSGRTSKAGRLENVEFWKELSPSAHADVRHLHRVSSPELIGVRYPPRPVQRGLAGMRHRRALGEGACISHPQ